jgi:nucleoside 2-deoxyribosyltransferase
MPRLYLAGPDVFLPDPLAQADRKKALCRQYGFEGVFPLDAAPDLAGVRGPADAGLAIARANEETMRACDLAVANATPFRGPSLDPGTAYEMGFMRALGKPVFAYANAPGPYLDRVEAHYGTPLVREGGGRWTAPDGMSVEDFGLADNLMIVGAAEASGGALVVEDVPEGSRHTDLAAFEACLRLARQRFAEAPRAAAAGPSAV